MYVYVRVLLRMGGCWELLCMHFVVWVRWISAVWRDYDGLWLKEDAYEDGKFARFEYVIDFILNTVVFIFVKHFNLL